MRAAVAAGHPATAEAGAEILHDGGTAADAAVAACLASCVAETVMTGFLGGGHAIYFDAATARARNLDCFVAVPGLDGNARETRMLELAVPFGEELVHYAVGIASCGVPGVPAGLDELWRWYGRLPWERLVEPALRLARDGVRMTQAQASCLAMLAPVMTMNEGADIYSRGGKLLEEGDTLEQPGLAAALGVVAEEGARSAYGGTLGRSILQLVEERGGVVTRRDLDGYRARWSDPVTADYVGCRLLTRDGLTGVRAALGRLPRLRGRSDPERAVAWADALAAGTPNGETTNITVVDRDGNACVLTTSLGLGSGDFVPGFDLHLNSMLGEAELVREPLEPGERMASMMAPTIAADREGLVLAAGAAGGTRLRAALLQSIAGVLDEGLRPQAAVARARLHRIGSAIHLEPGWSGETVDALAAAGYEVKTWPSQHHYFGGVSLVGRSGAAGDPRRSGAAVPC
jgi:gamma-glutamyltranspeptidase/glutathione hydrolase